MALRDLAAKGLTEQQVALRLHRTLQAVKARAKRLRVTLTPAKRLPYPERVARLA